MAKQHQISYDLMKENAFTVHLPDIQIKVTKTEQGFMFLSLR